MIPVVLGPRNQTFILDHHHLCLALLKECVQDILVDVVLDLRALKSREFWTYLDNRAWCHPYDEMGKRVDFKSIPSKVASLKDDPYRSLAGDLRRAGGFAKDTTPFSEFIWAEYLRRRIKSAMVESDIVSAMARAMSLAKAQAASYLPGWCGPNTSKESP